MLPNLLTFGIPVEQERILMLEFQVFGYRFCQVMHAKTIHYHETIMGCSRPVKRTRKYLYKDEWKLAFEHQYCLYVMFSNKTGNKPHRPILRYG